MTIQLHLPVFPGRDPVALSAPQLEADDGMQCIAAVPQDADELRLRQEDASAASPEWRAKVREAIQQHGGIAYRDAAGRLLGLFGITAGSGYALPWLLCDDIPAELRRLTLRVARGWVGQLMTLAGERVLIANRVPRDSVQNRRFLRSLGFRIEADTATGPDLFYLPNHV